MTEPKKRIRRTKAQIAADNAAADQKRAELAEVHAARIPTPRLPKWIKTIHFVNDGVSVFGKVWYRGEEITIEEGDEFFERAFDRKGNFLFSKTDEEQMEIYGQVMYRQGPWPGLGYDLNVYEPGQFDGDRKITASPAERAALEKANRKRGLQVALENKSKANRGPLMLNMD